jgi:tetratricopeptide (TPR) repeat protein
MGARLALIDKLQSCYFYRMLTPTVTNFPSIPPSAHFDVPLRLHVLALALLSLLVLGAYANSFQSEFVQDNRAVILEDMRLQAADAKSLTSIMAHSYWWPTTEAGLYRPVTTLSYLFNYSLLGNGAQPAGYHVINYILHVCNAFLVYLLGLALLRRFAPAIFTAGFWALHPITTESVTNIVGRADELAAMCVLGSLLLYIRSTAALSQRRWLWLAAMMIVMTVGVFSKENAVAIPGLVILYDFTYRLRPHDSRPVHNVVKNFGHFALESYGTLVAPLLAMWYARSVVFAGSPPAYFPFLENPLTGVGFVTARMTALKIIGKYIFLLLWPRKLSCDYSYNQIPLVNLHLVSWEDWQALVAVAVILGILSIAVLSYRRQKAITFYIGLSALTLLPTANLLILIGSIMAERFLYLPAVGFAGCAVLAVYAAANRLRLPPALAPAVLSVAVAIYGVRTFVRNRDWKEEETLWTSAVNVSPASYKTHFGLANAWADQDPALLQNNRIIAETEKALAIVSRVPDGLNHVKVFSNLGWYYLKKGDAIAAASSGRPVSIQEGRECYQKALQLLLRGVAVDRAITDVINRREVARGRSPANYGLGVVYGNLGLVYLRLGEHQRALEAFRYLRRLAVTNPEVYQNIATALLAAGKTEEAIITLLEARMIEKSERVTPEILKLYAKMDSGGCAIADKEGRSALNTGCPIVHRHVCAADAELERVFRESNRDELAEAAENDSWWHRCGTGQPHTNTVRQ